MSFRKFLRVLGFCIRKLWLGKIFGNFGKFLGIVEKFFGFDEIRAGFDEGF